MSTSDQQGNQPLTRKQLREIRLTGATPVITEEEAAAAAATPALPAPVPRSVEPAEAPRSDEDVDLDATPLTRRQVREHERVRTASVPVIGAVEDTHTDDEPQTDASAEGEDEIVSGVPVFASADEAQSDEVPADVTTEDVTDDEAVEDDSIEDVATAEAATEEDVPANEVPEDDASVDDFPEEDALETDDSPVEAVAESAEDDSAVDDPIAEGERPVLNPTFGKGLLKEHDAVPAFTPSFDELITSNSGGSQNIAPNTLIFNPSLGNGSLSGPVASTGELLITGSYDLPRGIGSHGHAHGTADGKEADAVLIDGELPPSSSPTPIAASSAISTTKPAGEVIRPPAPEKGNKLMLTLAITAGGLALALAVVLIVAFTTNVV